MRSHKWAEGLCANCGLRRARRRSMGYTYFFEYFRDGKTIGYRCGPCPGKPKAK